MNSAACNQRILKEGVRKKTMSKKLQIDYIHVKKVEFGAKTELKDGILTVNKEELMDLAKSELFGSLDIKLAVPGESCRILGIHDVMQPRCKGRCPGNFVSGNLGEACTHGRRTHSSIKRSGDLRYILCEV